ncbi:hypothetical protein P7K49_024639, partial [Saguinus oedipus]
MAIDPSALLGPWLFPTLPLLGGWKRDFFFFFLLSAFPASCSANLCFKLLIDFSPQQPESPSTHTVTSPHSPDDKAFVAVLPFSSQLSVLSPSPREHGLPLPHHVNFHCRMLHAGNTSCVGTFAECLPLWGTFLSISKPDTLYKPTDLSSPLPRPQLSCSSRWLSGPRVRLLMTHSITE